MSDIDYTVPAEMPDYRTEPEAHAERLNWHGLMAAKHEREKAEQVAVFDAEIRRLKDERSRLVAEHDARIEHHTAPIEAYHMALLRDRGVAGTPRTLRMPYGTSSLTVPVTRRVEFVDKSAALEWVRENHPDHLKVDVLVSAMRSIGTVTDDGTVIDLTTGEIVPGVEAVLPEPSWRLTPSDADPVDPF